MKIYKISILLAAVLTARLGTINYNGHRETWYNLDMSNVVAKTDKAIGMTDLYNVREDGVKCYSKFVIVAADLDIHPRYTFVETSLGTGVVLDSLGDAEDRETIDIATTWGKEK